MAFHWLKVHAELPHHRKSLELAHELGEPLAWAYVIQLWGWCLKHAPEGRIAHARAQGTVEAACGWRGERGALFKALLLVGFLDADDESVLIHDWEEEQKPILAKALRDAERKRERRSNGATTARAARADGAGTALTASQSLVSSSLEKGVQGEEKPRRRAEDLQDAWNAGRPLQLAQWKGMSKTRRARAVMRLGDRPLSEWVDVIARIRSSSFCLGQNERGWRAHPDWLLEPGTADKVLEGLYDARVGGKAKGPPGEVTREDFEEATSHLERDQNGDLVL